MILFNICLSKPTIIPASLIEILYEPETQTWLIYLNFFLNQIIMKYHTLLLVLFFQHMPSYSKSNATLEFHMGLGGGNKYKIGGTIRNNSNVDIPHGAITYITIDDSCNPSNAKVANFGPINPNDDFEFNIPIDERISSYRILNVSGWNKFGIPIKIEDKNEDVIKSRESDWLKKCNSE